MHFTILDKDEKKSTPETKTTLESPIELVIVHNPSEITPQIIEEAYKIDIACFEEGIAYSKENLAAEIKKSPLLLALNKKNGQLLGNLTYEQRSEKGKSKRHITNLAVDPKFQSQGIGKALLTELIRDTSDTVSLKCRPSNESYYQQFGFKTTGIPQIDYYRFQVEGQSMTAPGLSMLLEKDEKKDSIPENKKDAKRSEKKSTPLDKPTRQAYLESLLDLTKKVRASTSFFFGSSLAAWFHKQRKEKAFAAIISELQACLLNDKPIDPLKILRAIVHNAMVVRGASPVHTQTSSGQALVGLLKQKSFEKLRALIEEELLIINYKNLKEFAQFKPGSERSAAIPQPFSPYFHFSKHERKDIPKFTGYRIKLISQEPTVQEMEAAFLAKDILIQENEHSYGIIFFNPIEKAFQKKTITDEKLSALLDEIKPPQTITNHDIRYQAINLCTRHGSTHFDQNRLLKIFQQIMHLVCKHRPDLVEIYQLRELSIKDMAGICFGLGIAKFNPNHHFSALMRFACSLDQTDLENLVEGKKITVLEKNYGIEDFLYTYKKIHAWQNTNHLTTWPHHQYRASLNKQWVNSLSFSDRFINLNGIFKKILSREDKFWAVTFYDFSLASEIKDGHSIFVRKDEQGQFHYFDSNINATRWIGGFESIDNLTDHILKFYQPHATDEIIVIANALSPIEKDNVFDTQVAVLDNIFKRFPGAWINYHIRQYLSGQISQVEFSQAVVTQLTPLEATKQLFYKIKPPMHS